METSKGASAGRRASSTLEVNPRELYRICKEQADGIEATPYGKRVRDLAAHLLFSRPLFETTPVQGDEQAPRARQATETGTFTLLGNYSRGSAWRQGGLTGCPLSVVRCALSVVSGEVKPARSVKERQQGKLGR